MMNRSIVTTEVAVCFTTSCILFGTGAGKSLEAACGVASCVGLVAVGVIPSPQTLPNVTERKRSGFAKLLDVPELMQKKLRIEPGAACHKDGPAESYGCYGGLAEEKATNSQWKAAAPKSQRGQFGPAVGQIGRQLEVLPEKLSA